MGYIHKNTTFIIVLILMFVSLSYAGSTVFYKQTFENLNRELENRSMRIDQLDNDMSVLQANLKKANDDLNLKLKREEELSSQYLGVKDEKEDLEDQNTGLERNISIIRSDLSEARNTIADKDRQIKLLQSSITDLNSQVTKLNTQIKNLTEREDEYEDDLEDICKKAKSLNITECRGYN